MRSIHALFCSCTEYRQAMRESAAQPTNVPYERSFVDHAALVSRGIRSSSEQAAARAGWSRVRSYRTSPVGVKANP